MPKTKSAVTGKYTKAKGADPAKTYQSDDYPARQLRKLIKMWEAGSTADDAWHIAKLCIAIKKRMKWDQPKPRKVK